MPGWIDQYFTGYATIENNGATLPQRSTLNFIGMTVADDPINNVTKVTGGTAGGSTGYLTSDVTSGTISGATAARVVALQGNPVANLAPSDTYVLTWSAAHDYWYPATATGQTGYLTGDVATSTIIGATGARVLAIQGYAVENIAPTDKYILTWSAANGWWYPNAPGSSGGQTGYLTGDVSTATINGNTHATVIGLYGNPVAVTAPLNGQVLTWSAGSDYWYPATATGATGYLSGDVTTTTISGNTTATVTQLTGAADQVVMRADNFVFLGSLTAPSIQYSGADNFAIEVDGPLSITTGYGSLTFNSTEDLLAFGTTSLALQSNEATLNVGGGMVLDAVGGSYTRLYSHGALLVYGNVTGSQHYFLSPGGASILTMTDPEVVCTVGGNTLLIATATETDIYAGGANRFQMQSTAFSLSGFSGNGLIEVGGTLELEATTELNLTSALFYGNVSTISWAPSAVSGIKAQNWSVPMTFNGTVYNVLLNFES